MGCAGLVMLGAGCTGAQETADSNETKEGAGPSSSLEDARRVALEMPRTIDYADWEAFTALFADDAIMYFPFASERADSKSEIAAVMQPIFARNADRLPGPIFGFEPYDVRTEEIGTSGAIVTWMMRTGDILQRRTVVLRLDRGEWRILLVHADGRPT
jgi:hypothetical protein